MSIKEVLAQMPGALAGSTVALLLKRAWEIRDRRQDQAEKRDDERATVAAKGIEDAGALRRELWERIEHLEEKVTSLQKALFEEQDHRNECERRCAALDGRVRELEARSGNTSPM